MSSFSRCRNNHTKTIFFCMLGKLGSIMGCSVGRHHMNLNRNTKRF